MKAVTQVNSAIEATARNALEINYEKAAADAINKVKQDLAAKEIEQRLKQEIERQTEAEKKWKLQHCKNGHGEAIRYNKDRGKNNVNNHRGRP